MCKIVYLTTKRFDSAARDFRDALAAELHNRKVEVITDQAYDIFNIFKRHRTYGIALGFDFYHDGKSGCGLTLNKNCSFIGRDFAYNLSNIYDREIPALKWRNFDFVNSDDPDWYRFFNKVSSSTKAIFHLCTINNPQDWENYSVARENVIRIFADEIVRCLRSNYDIDDYRKRVKIAKLKIVKEKGGK